MAYPPGNALELGIGLPPFFFIRGLLGFAFLSFAPCGRIFAGLFTVFRSGLLFLFAEFGLLLVAHPAGRHFLLLDFALYALGTVVDSLLV